MMAAVRCERVGMLAMRVIALCTAAVPSPAGAAETCQIAGRLNGCDLISPHSSTLNHQHPLTFLSITGPPLLPLLMAASVCTARRLMQPCESGGEWRGRWERRSLVRQQRVMLWVFRSSGDASPAADRTAACRLTTSSTGMALPARPPFQPSLTVRHLHAGHHACRHCQAVAADGVAQHRHRLLGGRSRDAQGVEN